MTESVALIVILTTVFCCSKFAARSTRESEDGIEGGD